MPVIDENINTGQLQECLFEMFPCQKKNGHLVPGKNGNLLFN